MENLFVGLLGAAALAGCTITPAPKSWFVGEPEGVLRFHEFPVRVMSVDGSINFGNKAQLEPGRHVVVLQAATANHIYRGLQKNYVMNVEPCTRYYYLAERVSDLARDWNLKLKTSETVAGCDPAEELRKAGAAAAQHGL